MRMEEMTRDDFKETIKNDPVVIIPWGACEAHGPHLPLSADSIQPIFIADKIANRLENVLIAPTVNYALHSSTKNMPGTLCVSFDTVRSIAYDLVTSLHEQGINKVMIIAGHAGSGHLAAISEGCKKAVKETNVQVIFFSDWYISEGFDIAAYLKHDGHAGCIETSRLMAIRPDLVKNTKIPTGQFEQTYLILKDGSKCFPQGYQGDVSRASPEFGKMINDYIIETVIGMIQNDFCRNREPQENRC